MKTKRLLPIYHSDMDRVWREQTDILADIQHSP